MNDFTVLMPTPWDTEAFGLPTWELLEYSKAALSYAMKTPGHHTIKVEPFADTKLLHEYGFYYCDTLIQPYCTLTRLLPARHEDATISKFVELEPIRALCTGGTFAHGRFHRDFNLSNDSADLRYSRWLEQLHKEGQVYGLYWCDTLAGFIGHSENKLVLHALSSGFRGKGLAKFWWSAVCSDLLEAGYPEITSSISAANLAVVNLYCSLGFSFRAPQDIYHLHVPGWQCVTV